MKGSSRFEEGERLFYSSLKLLLKDKDVSENNFEKKVEIYKNSKIMSKLENKIFELFLYLNPKKENFKSDINRIFIINIFKYLFDINGIKYLINFDNNKTKEEVANNTVNSLKEKENQFNNYDNPNNTQNEILIKEEGNVKKNIEIEELIIKLAKIFDDNELLKILFNEISDLSNKEEYLEMLLLFIPEKEVEQILKVVKNNLRLEIENKTEIKEITEIFEKIFRKINLKTEAGFHYLKDIIVLFVQDKNNFITALKEIENKYLIENKELRCKQCFNLPTFNINHEKEITITYKCENIHSNLINKLQDLRNYKFKCHCCKELLFISNKNYICSNCKNIFCIMCIQRHFEKCATIFFILLDEIDNICPDLKEKYETYCELCQINLCKKCSLEHYHYVQKEKEINLNKEQLNKFEEIINKDYISTDQNIISAIKNIILNKKYKKNFKFIHFILKILGIDEISLNKLFDDFFSDDFQKYYIYLIK